MKLHEICYYMPFGLKGILTADYRDDYFDCDWADPEKFKEGTIWQLAGYADKDLNIPLGEGELEGLLWRNECSYTCFHGNGIKPLMHPLSDLTREIEHNGEKFVPIVELCKLYEGTNITVKELKSKSNIHGVKYIDDDDTGCVFAYHSKCGGFAINSIWDDQIHIVHNQLELFQKLHEWHFWLGDQSRFGQDIIDINTLK